MLRFQRSPWAGVLRTLCSLHAQLFHGTYAAQPFRSKFIPMQGRCSSNPVFFTRAVVSWDACCPALPLQVHSHVNPHEVISVRISVRECMATSKGLYFVFLSWQFPYLVLHRILVGLLVACPRDPRFPYVRSTVVSNSVECCQIVWNNLLCFDLSEPPGQVFFEPCVLYTRSCVMGRIRCFGS